MRGRFLQRLQERIPRRRREHMDLVNDVDLEAVARWAKPHSFLQAPHLVHTVVTRAVDLLDVEILSRRDLQTRRTCVAWRRGRAAGLAIRSYAIKALGEEACACRLADATNAGEEKRVRDPAAGDGVCQRPRDVILTDQVLE